MQLIDIQLFIAVILFRMNINNAKPLELSIVKVPLYCCHRVTG